MLVWVHGASVQIQWLMITSSLDVLEDLFGTSEEDNDGLGSPKADLCSECAVSLFRHIQSTPYSNYDENLASVWSNIQKTCGLSYPTEVQKLQTNLTRPGGFAEPGTPFSEVCLTDEYYTVVSGDNCQVIAEKLGVSTSAITVINSLYADCHDLWLGAVRHPLPRNERFLTFFRKYASLPSARPTKSRMEILATTWASSLASASPTFRHGIRT